MAVSSRKDWDDEDHDHDDDRLLAMRLYKSDLSALFTSIAAPFSIHQVDS